MLAAAYFFSYFSYGAMRAHVDGKVRREDEPDDRQDARFGAQIEGCNTRKWQSLLLRRRLLIKQGRRQFSCKG